MEVCSIDVSLEKYEDLEMTVVEEAAATRPWQLSLVVAWLNVGLFRPGILAFFRDQQSLNVAHDMSSRQMRTPAQHR